MVTALEVPSEAIEPVGSGADIPEVSVVMPCLNEARTLAGCILEAKEAMAASGIHGEIVIADNGSTDGSQTIAEDLGARVVAVPEKGYGCALRGGIEASRGRFIIMGDSDGSYNFGHIPRICEQLRNGYDLVMGNRFLGGIEPGAMPWHHRYIGNPILSGIGRLFFSCPAGDFHCGLRGFSRTAYRRMELNTTGMEFASEMVIKSSLKGLRIAEVPTVLRPDGRDRPPHLRSWRDGWRHLRFMLLHSPRWLFSVIGVLLFCLGIFAVTWISVAGSLPILGARLNVNGSLAAGMAASAGFQLLIFAVFARRFCTVLGTHPPSRMLKPLEGRVTLEHGVVIGLITITAGIAVLTSALLLWHEANYGVLSSTVTTSRVIPAITLLTLGMQTVFGSFLISMIGFIPKPQKPAAV